jgi:hypothetical protein
MSGARLHLVNGETLDVEQPANDTARMLWGRDSGDDAADMGYAALISNSKTVNVNPQAVVFVEDAASRAAYGTVPRG